MIKLLVLKELYVKPNNEEMFARHILATLSQQVL